MRELPLEVRRETSKIKTSKILSAQILLVPSISRGYSGDCSKDSEVFYSSFLLSILIIKITGNSFSCKFKIKRTKLAQSPQTKQKTQ